MLHVVQVARIFTSIYYHVDLFHFSVDRIVEAFKEKTKLQLRCFHFQDNPEPSDSYH